MKKVAKRLLITAPFGYSVKNLLYSSFWSAPELESFEKIYILTPLVDAFRKVLEEDQALFGKVEVLEWQPQSMRKVQTIAWEIRKQRHLQRIGSVTQRTKNWVQRNEQPLYYKIKQVLMGLAGLLPGSLLDRCILQGWNMPLPKGLGITHWLSLAPTFEQELPVAAYMRRDVPQVVATAFVHSWDNVTSKGFFIFPFQRYAVWGDSQLEEMKRAVGKKAEIVAVGMPQYDSWPPQGKQEAAGDPYVLYTTGHPATIPNEPALVANVRQLLPKTTELLVRLHPNDEAERYQHIAGLTVLEPGKRTAAVYDRWEPTSDDVLSYARLLRGATAVLNVASTVTLDAIRAGGVPICIAFDATDTPAWRSVARFYRYHHYAILLGYGLEKLVARDPSQLRDILEAVHQEANRSKLTVELAALFCHYDAMSDGNAGKRLATWTLR